MGNPLKLQNLLMISSPIVRGAMGNGKSGLHKNVGKNV